MIDRVSKVVKKTYLSGRPAVDSHIVAFICFAILFLCSFFFWRIQPEFQRHFIASQEGVFEHGKVWQLVTATFIHSNVRHFLANSVMFSFLTLIIYGYFGSLSIIVLLLPIGVLINGITILNYPLKTGLLGASGAVYAMGSFWLVLYMLIDRRRTLGKRLMRGLGFSIVVFLPSTFEPQTSYLAHFVGFALGAIYGGFYFFANKDSIRSAEVVDLDVVTEDPYFFQ